MHIFPTFLFLLIGSTWSPQAFRICVLAIAQEVKFHINSWICPISPYVLHSMTNIFTSNSVASLWVASDSWDWTVGRVGCESKWRLKVMINIILTCAQLLVKKSSVVFTMKRLHIFGLSVKWLVGRNVQDVQNQYRESGHASFTSMPCPQFLNHPILIKCRVLLKTVAGCVYFNYYILVHKIHL
jgi:hypothetical protein